MSTKDTSYPKEKIKILFLENISDKAVDQFRANGYSNIEKLRGAGVGILVPHLHKTKLMKNASITPQIGKEYTGFAVNYRF